MKKKQESKPGRTSNESRRDFLKGAVAAGGVAAVVVATGQNVMADENMDVVSVPKSKGYQETQHVRDYYDSLRH